MAGSLKEMALDWTFALINPLPSDGSTSPLLVKTSVFWNGRRLVSNNSLPLSFSWECSGLGFLLNTITLESPTLSVSTDPILEMTGNLAEFQGSLPTFGTPYLLRYTDLILAWAETLITPPIKVTFFNLLDSDDAITLFCD